MLVMGNQRPAEPVEAEKIVRKMRWRLLPLLFLLYVIAFLDRINIGFAALTMNNELGITSQQFGLIAGIFFIAISIWARNSFSTSAGFQLLAISA